MPKTDHHAEAHRLTSKEIRGRQRELTAMERVLTEQLIAAEKSSGGGGGPAVDEDQRKIREGAAKLLNGQGAYLLPPLKTDNLAGIWRQREMVRVAHAALLRADVEAIAAEATAWVLENRAGLTKLAAARDAARDAAAKAREMGERAAVATQAFLETAPEGAREALVEMEF